MTIGAKIAARRKELGLTLEDIGNAVGVGKSTVKKWESGYIANMRRDKISALAKILQISPVELVKEDDSLNLEEDDTLNDNEEQLLELYRNFNEEGKEKLLDTASDMAQLERYKKCDKFSVVSEEA